jgi:medium-chain acyl-[acyl-carrier-protein] hydrolase
MAVTTEFVQRRNVASYEVDTGGCLQLQSLCNWMQEAAYLHADELGLGYKNFSARGQAWVLSRLRLDVTKLPEWGETVVLKSFPSGFDRLFFYRDFSLISGSGELYVQASTSWFLLDISARCRAPASLWQDSDVPHSSSLFSRRPERIRAHPEEGPHARLVLVLPGDLDLNGHVNHVRYLDWILNSYSIEFLRDHRPKHVEVNYLTEAVCGDALKVSTHIQQRSFLHGVHRGSDLLLKAMIEWQGR